MNFYINIFISCITETCYYCWLCHTSTEHTLFFQFCNYIVFILFTTSPAEAAGLLNILHLIITHIQSTGLSCVMTGAASSTVLYIFFLMLCPLLAAGMLDNVLYSTSFLRVCVCMSACVSSDGRGLGGHGNGGDGFSGCAWGGQQGPGASSSSWVRGCNCRLRHSHPAPCQSHSLRATSLAAAQKSPPGSWHSGRSLCPSVG